MNPLRLHVWAGLKDGGGETKKEGESKVDRDSEGEAGIQREDPGMTPDLLPQRSRTLLNTRASRPTDGSLGVPMC